MHTHTILLQLIGKQTWHPFEEGEASKVIHIQKKNQKPSIHHREITGINYCYKITFSLHRASSNKSLIETYFKFLFSYIALHLAEIKNMKFYHNRLQGNCE